MNPMTHAHDESPGAVPMNAPAEQQHLAAAAPAKRRKKTRKQGLTAVAVLVVLAGAGYGAWHFIVGQNYESTDNAYVQGNLIQITPQVGGTVLAINADDTDVVKAGQVLVRLDPADAQVALDQAEAQLAQTVREVRTLYANNATFKAQVALREADVARLKSDMVKAQGDVARREPLLATGAVGREEYNHATAQLSAARSAVAAAESAVVAAREQLASNQVLTDGTSVEEHPNVQRAAARVREAVLAKKRVELPAPVDGTIAKRSVQLGQRVAAGAPLMALIPLKQLWVDANFKEAQLRNLRVGQPATLVADVYGKHVEYKGAVVGVGAGTGSAFSLLPAQNATGNWIKVVQRVPVRIAFDAGQLAAHPLRVGLSMDVTVDVHDQSGKTLADAPRNDSTLQTTVFDADDREADAAVQRIIAANLGKQVSALARAAAPVRPRAADAAVAQARELHTTVGLAAPLPLAQRAAR
jgi:membrane fusion protein (multidrug efflux system)